MANLGGSISHQKIVVSVIGSHGEEGDVNSLAHKVGKIVAEVGCILLCGGLGGVMENSCKGARESGGLTIGLLPGNDKADANPYVDIALPTTLGFARNACVAGAADIMVALPGSHGTNSEICYGLVYGRPVIDLGGWGIKGMITLSGIDALKGELKRLIGEIR